MPILTNNEYDDGGHQAQDVDNYVDDMDNEYDEEYDKYL